MINLITGTLMKKSSIGLILFSVLTIGTACTVIKKGTPNSALFKTSIKAPIESMVKFLGRLDDSTDFRRLQGAIDNLLTDSFAPEEDRDITELDRKTKYQIQPKPKLTGL